MKKPLALLITDSHFTKENTAIVIGIFQQAFKICQERGISSCFHLGDVFTERLGHGLNVLMSFLFVLEEAKRCGITIHCIAGNHDKTDLESEDSYLDIYASHPALVLYRKQTIVEFGGKFCAFLPYFKEDGSYPARLQSLLSDKIRLGIDDSQFFLFTHIAINGVKNNDGSSVVNNLAVKRFANFRSVFVGHYHNKSNFDNIWYIGSPRPKDFGEDNDKGFTLLNTDGSQVFIPSVCKQYKKVKFDLSDKSVAEVYQFAKNNMQMLENCNIKIECTGDDGQLVKLDDYKLKNMGFYVEKHNKNLVKSINAAESGEVMKFTDATIMECFKEFCHISNIPEERVESGIIHLQNK